jgi:exonuclease III
MQRARSGQTWNYLKIATFNVDGVNGRLPVLPRSLAESKPDVACLQELKAPPEISRGRASRGGLWSSLARPEELEWRRRSRPGSGACRESSRVENAWARDAGAAHRSSASQPVDHRAARQCGVSREVRGCRTASDHAPTWGEIADS